MTSRLSLLFGLLLLLPILGCGPSGPPEYQVSGSVSFENQPVVDGDIIFEPADGKTQHRAGKIINGNYSFTVPPGAKVVKILATKEIGERDKVMNMVARKQYIPPEYNTQSELKAEVTADTSKNVFDFKLTGAKPASP